MCGMPHRSRTTRTGAERPSTAIVPDTCGSGPGGGGSAWRRHAAPIAATQTARTVCVRLRRMAIKEALLAEYDHEMGTTRKLLERVPEDKLTWKPHEKSMTLGGLATHLGNLPNWAARILNDSGFDLASAPPNLDAKTSRAEILDLFDGSTRQARAAMDKTDAEYMGRWALKRGGQEMFA